MPEVTLNLRIALGLLAVFLVIGALVSFITLKGTDGLPNMTIVPSPTETVTITPTPTETLVPTETPTLTTEPPIEYVVKSGDSCISIANLYGSSASAIISLNSLNSSCTNLQIGQTIKVPRPTPTPLPAPTATLEPAAATRAACQGQTVTGSGTISSGLLPFSPSLTLTFPPAGGPVSGVITGQQPFMSGSETCTLSVNGTADGTFAGGDGGAISGSMQITLKVICSAGSNTHNYSITWQGTLKANGTGSGTWDSAYGVGSWQVSYSAADFQSRCNLP